jgi:hypothetical protein
MKIPCELIVWYVLPTIRREIAKELVTNYHMTQAEVAKRFGVTDAAISQYLKKKRGDSAVIEGSGLYKGFLEEVSVSARKIAEENGDVSVEICRICGYVKRCGMLAEIYESQGAQVPKEVCPSDPGPIVL